MIGDWLMYNKMPYRVTQVSSMDAGQSGSSYILENGEYDCGEPIHLTRIHLAKNGFVAEDETDEVFVYKNGYEIRVEFDEGFPEEDIPPSIFLSIMFAEKDLCMQIEYVHELQQALRMFDIDIEIKLW